MDGVKPKAFDGPVNDASEDVAPQSLPETVDGRGPPKKRKTRHKTFIDLQKQPPKPKPLVQE